MRSLFVQRRFTKHPSLTHLQLHGAAPGHELGEPTLKDLHGKNRDILGGCTSYGAGTVPTPPAAGPRHVWLSQQHLGNKLFTRSYFSLL